MHADDIHRRAAQRDAAFARMYEADERCERLLAGNELLWARLIELCDLIAHDETLQLLDPEGVLICRARQIIGTCQLYPRGRQALTKYQARQGEPST